MTQREKIEMLKSTIEVLYVKEGRGKSYISRLLEVDRKTLSDILNYEWKFEQGNSSYLTPSNQKFLNRHRNLIKSRLDNDIAITDIAKELDTTRDYISSTIIPKDKVLSEAKEHYHQRIKSRSQKAKDELKEKSSFNYEFEDLSGEIWKEILGYESYFISNRGRVKKYIKTYDDYILISTHNNVRNDRVYVWIGDKALQVARLVGFNFIEGHSEINDTINHKDKDVTNNDFNNLEWISQAENNKHAHNNGRSVVKSYQRYGRFKKIILDGKYEFKTIKALAKFIGKSETQTRRYIDGECESSYKFEFIY